MMKYLCFCILLGISVTTYSNPAPRTTKGAVARPGDLILVSGITANNNIDNCNFSLQVVPADSKMSSFWCIKK
jgi:hypothetical protein